MIRLLYLILTQIPFHKFPLALGKLQQSHSAHFHPPQEYKLENEAQEVYRLHRCKFTQDTLRTHPSFLGPGSKYPVELSTH